MAVDYTPITSPPEEVGGTFAEWWRQGPYVIRRWTFAPYKGEVRRLSNAAADVLAPTGATMELYDPFDEPDLLTALLDVAQGNLKPAQFADRYGLLGYNHIVADEYRCPGGADPLEWFMAHARTAFTIAELIRLLKGAEGVDGDKWRLANFLKEEISQDVYALGGLVKYLPGVGEKQTDPIARANHILLFLLNANLGKPLPIEGAEQWSEKAGSLDVGRRLHLSGGKFHTYFTFHALVQVVYWQLADQLEHSSIHRCAECARIFTHTNPRARFCPPASGKQISPCKARWNVREFRRKKQPRRKKR